MRGSLHSLNKASLRPWWLRQPAPPPFGRPW
jgi:hypothetical protein